MNYLYVFLPILIHIIYVGSDRKVHSRKKRYVAFPEGSTFAVTVCPTVATGTSFGLYFQGVNWGVAYTLPNRSSVQEYVLSKHVKRRREKRELYSRMETIMNDMGINGRSCIQRALCEASQKFQIKAKSISEDMLRILFSFPLQLLSDGEPEQHHVYHSAYRKRKSPRNKVDCASVYPDCFHSIIDIALGNYKNDNV